MENKTLIIGGGLAGLTVALELIDNKEDILVIDRGENYSSRIAAGLINPIVFRRMAQSWRVNEYLPFAEKYYKKLEDIFESSYYHNIPIRRAFAHKQEEDLWLEKEKLESYSPYIQKLTKEDKENDSVINTYGSGKVTSSAYVDTNKLLSDIHNYLIKQGNLIYEKTDYNAFNPEESTYKQTKYKRIIFCEGYHMLENPWFNYLPLQATKGETLTIQSSEITEKESLNRKCFILPIGKQLFKVGATYVWDDTSLCTTEKAKAELESHIQSLTTATYVIKKQEAGIRPTVVDRRPLIGSHPTYKNLFIFNGLGTKGYLMAPLLSKEFISHMLKNTSLNKEVNIDRFAKKFTNTH
jgi:glycine oxidase